MDGWMCLPDNPLIIQVLTVKNKITEVRVVPSCLINLLKNLLLVTLHFPDKRQYLLREGPAER